MKFRMQKSIFNIGAWHAMPLQGVFVFLLLLNSYFLLLTSTADATCTKPCATPRCQYRFHGLTGTTSSLDAVPVHNGISQADCLKDGDLAIGDVNGKYGEYVFDAASIEAETMPASPRIIQPNGLATGRWEKATEELDTSNFDGILSATEDDVQEAMDAMDDHTHAVATGGTGASTLTGYVKGNGTSPLTASATIPNTDITGLGTMSTQNANSVAITGGTMTGVSGDLNTGATYVICSNSAATPWRCDYTCDGTDDHVQFQAAENACPTISLRPRCGILATEGRFWFSAPVEIDHGNFTLAGVGSEATTFFLKSGVNDDMFKFTNNVTDQYFITFRDFSAYGNRPGFVDPEDGGAGNSAGKFFDVKNHATNGLRDFHTEHIFIEQFPDDAIETDCVWGWTIGQGTIIEFNTGYGIDAYGTVCATGLKVLGTKIIANDGGAINLNGVQQSILSGNEFSGGNTATAHGISISNSAIETVISGNTFASGASMANYPDMINTNALSTVITSNIMRSGGASTQYYDYAVNIESGGDSPTIANNVFSGAWNTGKILDNSGAGPGNEIKFGNNVGYASSNGGNNSAEAFVRAAVGCDATCQTNDEINIASHGYTSGNGTALGDIIETNATDCGLTAGTDYYICPPSVGAAADYFKLDDTSTCASPINLTSPAGADCGTFQMRGHSFVHSLDAAPTFCMASPSNSTAVARAPIYTQFNSQSLTIFFNSLATAGWHNFTWYCGPTN